MFWNSVGANCVRPNEPLLSEIGKLVDYEINKISTIYNAVIIDKYVVMPNHIHMIIMILSDEYGRPQVAPTVSRLVKQFKGSISKQVGFPVW